MLILDAGGKRAGRIMCQRHLASDDLRLTRIFEDQVNDLIEPDDIVWDEKVLSILRQAGYTVLT
jgi:hypothetical protein